MEALFPFFKKSFYITNFFLTTPHSQCQASKPDLIDTYMAALGFEKGTDVGRFKNKEYETWDILPRNVLVDADGDIYVVDAEIKRL